MTVLPAFEQAGQSFCVPSMALILLSCILYRKQKENEL